MKIRNCERLNNQKIKEVLSCNYTDEAIDFILDYYCESPDLNFFTKEYWRFFEMKGLDLLLSAFFVEDLTAEEYSFLYKIKYEVATKVIDIEDMNCKSNQYLFLKLEKILKRSKVELFKLTNTYLMLKKEI